MVYDFLQDLSFILLASCNCINMVKYVVVAPII